MMLRLPLTTWWFVMTMRRETFTRVPDPLDLEPVIQTMDLVALR